jgi:2-polyprenyl-3-methyl-5-hydroxy-6-metoxy-1,4-benzoquinol methylase
MSLSDKKTTRAHWENVWRRDPRTALLSWLDVGSRNLQRLLRRHVRPGMRYLEIGCAPGRLLAWVAVKLQADVSGLDYSPTGCKAARETLLRLGVAADLRCEDVFENSFNRGSFDVVASFGLIEHFDDPMPVVQRHIELLRSGGVALVVVPNYRGLYGRLQGRFDPKNLEIHNLDIMERNHLLALIPPGTAAFARSYAIGRVAPGLINFDKRWHPSIAKAAERLLNLLGTVQPFDFSPLCPLLVLEITRA